MNAPFSSAPAAPISQPLASLRPSAVLSGVVQILASHAILAIAGVASLPVLVRNLGPSAYGQFSYFATVLGVIAYLDFARPILIPRCASGSPANDRAARDIAAANSLWMVLAAGLAGFFLLGPRIALPLSVAIAFHGSGSRDYATLCSQGRVGVATGIRQVIWGVAVLCAAGLSFLTSSVEVFAWCFALANLAITLAYHRMAGTQLAWAWQDLLHARASELWKNHGSGIRDVIGFNLASAVMVCADRVILRHTSGGSDFGHYAAQTDLALKLTIFGTAMGSVMYPLLAQSVRDEGEEATARKLLSLASWITPAYFIGVLALVFLDKQVVSFFLGGDYLESRGLYSATLIGIFLQHFGFLLTPLLRSRGDFRTPRRAYNAGAVLMLITGLLFVPTLGAFGAVLAYLFSRSAELLLLVHECGRMPSSFHVPRRLAVAAAMLATIVLVIGLRS